MGLCLVQLTTTCVELFSSTNYYLCLGDEKGDDDGHRHDGLWAGLGENVLQVCY